MHWDKRAIGFFYIVYKNKINSNREVFSVNQSCLLLFAVLDLIVTCAMLH